MTQEERVIVNSFATECFRNVADTDYVAARMHSRFGLIEQFQWSALQAIEKYLKAILLYNARAIQYGFFTLGGAKPPQETDPLFTLAGIRFAEALECADNADIIAYGMEVVMDSLSTLREKLPLKGTIGQMIAGVR
jgi:hypothetical protein